MDECKIHGIIYRQDDCPVCFLMRWLADDERKRFYELFPKQNVKCTICGRVMGDHPWAELKHLYSAP